MTKIALVGAGWSGRVHALAAAATPGATLVTLSTTSIGSAEEFAAQLQVRPVNTDALPGKADVVVLATPPSTHASLATAMLSKGTPVVIETPLARTLAEADEIIATAERFATSALYAESLLFAPALELAVARRHQLGALRHLEVRMSLPRPDWGYQADESVAGTVAGSPSGTVAGGVLFEVGCHALAVALLLVGEDTVDGVRARVESSRPDGVDDVARVELRFASGFIATVDVDWFAEVAERSAQCASDSGAVRVEFEPHCAVEHDGEVIALPEPPELPDRRLMDLGYISQTEGFVSAIAGRGGKVCPAGFGRAVLELITAAYASAGADGEEVELPYTGDRSASPMETYRAAETAAEKTAAEKSPSEQSPGEASPG
jgi:predicted dehydrogenase